MLAFFVERDGPDFANERVLEVAHEFSVQGLAVALGLAKQRKRSSWLARLSFKGR